MSRTDFLPASGPVRLAKTIHDSEGAVQRAIPQAALALLPALHREAGRDLDLWRFLAASPQFCIALMLQGAVALGAGSGALDASFVWAAAILVGIAAVTGNHIRGVATSPRPIALHDTARELRLLLVYLGVAWGFGAFLILPHKPALAVLFAVIPSLTAALILRDEKGAIAFGGPTVLLTAGALLLSRGAGSEQAWAGAILLAGLGIIVLSMFQRAMLRRRAQDLH
jgi:hypothetical protein